MAGGAYIKALDEIEGLLVAVKDVIVKIKPVVFESPPYNL